MSSAKIEEIIDTTEDHDGNDAEDGSEDDVPVDETSTVGAGKKKKKKKSKAARALAALTGKPQVPQELVDRVLEQAKADGLPGVRTEDLTEETVRLALDELRIVDVVKGKAGLGGINKKDMGEHKACLLNQSSGTNMLNSWIVLGDTTRSTTWCAFSVTSSISHSDRTPGEGPPEEDGYIEPPIPTEQVRQDAYPLPDAFEWSTIDIQDPVQLKELYNLLSNNYVEDDEAAFRFRYTAEFLQWYVIAGPHPQE